MQDVLDVELRDVLGTVAAVGDAINGSNGAINGSNGSDGGGFGFNVGGGNHHAQRTRGEGYCIFNDVAVGVLAGVRMLAGKRKCQMTGENENAANENAKKANVAGKNAAAETIRIVVIDLDVHQGNGTAEYFPPSERQNGLRHDQNFWKKKTNRQWSKMDVKPKRQVSSPAGAQQQQQQAKAQAQFEDEFGRWILVDGAELAEGEQNELAESIGMSKTTSHRYRLVPPAEEEEESGAKEKYAENWFCEVVPTDENSGQSKKHYSKWTQADCHRFLHEAGGITASCEDTIVEVTTLSLHEEDNFPWNKARSSLDVGLASETGDAVYLRELDRALQALTSRLLHGNKFSGRPSRLPLADLVLYVAGADPFEADPLGGLNISLEGLRRRDEAVFRWCRNQNQNQNQREGYTCERETINTTAATQPTSGASALCEQRPVPVAVVLAGGYASAEEVAQIHFGTFQELMRSRDKVLFQNR